MIATPIWEKKFERRRRVVFPLAVSGIDFDLFKTVWNHVPLADDEEVAPMISEDFKTCIHVEHE